MTHRVWLEINLKKVQSNFAVVQKNVAPLEVMAVLKANAYGLGVRPIAKALATVGAKTFGVAELHEALEIIDLGLPVQIIGGILKEEIPTIVKEGIIAPITDLEIAKALNDEAKKQGKMVTAHFLIDSGMGRLGIAIRDAKEVISACLELKNITPAGIYSHFPQAYDNKDFSLEQVASLINLSKDLKQTHDIEIEQLHIANSDGINNISVATKAPFTMVRTGINLYGVFDTQGRKALELQEALTLKTRLLSVRKLPAGTSIGYGRTAILEKDTLVGTIAIGYADGFPLAMSNNGEVSINDLRCPILGRISMDYSTVSLENATNAKVGDEVICLGNGITVDDWAKKKNTHTYDIICSIGNRVARIYR